jgi:DNA-binding NarL/FixJ family response regulator
MRAILVGPAAARERMRLDLESRAIEIAAEFESAAEARASGVIADLIVSAADSPPHGPVQGPAAASARSASAPREAGHYVGTDAIQEPLTPREIQVLELMAEGLPNKGIAARLGISDQTVKFHVAAIMGKLDASNRTDAVRRAVRRGLVSL